MSSALRLSTIVPVYNEAAHLREVLEYLQGTPCPVEREWIVVDDASTDGSVEVLRSLALQGKKASWKDGIAALWHPVRFNALVPPAKAFVDLPPHDRADRSHVNPRLLEERYSVQMAKG